MTSRHNCGFLWLNIIQILQFIMNYKITMTWRHATTVVFYGLILFEPTDLHIYFQDNNQSND